MTADTLRAWVEIDIDAFIHNLGVAKKLTGTKVMAVVKGNAHGHGARESKFGSGSSRRRCFCSSLHVRGH